MPRLPLALPAGGLWVRQSGSLGRFQRPGLAVPLVTGMAWADAGVAPGGEARLRVTATDAGRPDLPPGADAGPPDGPWLDYAARVTGRLTAVDPDRPDGDRARTLGRHPPPEASGAGGGRSSGLPLTGGAKELGFGLRESAAVGRVQPVLNVTQRDRRDRYVGPPLEVWPAPTFADGPHWDAADPGVFRPSVRARALAVDEGTELTAVVRVRPDDDVRHAELVVRVWAVAGGERAVMDALPGAGWVPRVWQGRVASVAGEGPDPFGDLRFRWRAVRHGPTERAVAHLRSATPGATDAYGSGRAPVYVARVRVNGVARQLPPLDVVGPEAPPRSTPS